ncbi:MAG: hypothetical protein J5928_02725 [Firmicutes bacterium]|nr:hypothetical protein [Bacillota bacterium]
MDDLKNTLDSDLLSKVDDILTGKTKAEDVPELVFSEEVPKDYDISADLHAEEIMAESISAAQAAEGGFTPEIDIQDAEFNYNVPQAPDFGNFAGGSQQQMPQGSQTWNGQEQTAQQQEWNELKAKREEKKGSGSGFAPETKAKIGFGVGLVAMIAAVFGVALGIVPVAIGIYYAIGGLKGSKRKLSIAGLVMCCIGALLWIVAVFGGGLFS